ncbi:ribonuclease HI family protein [Massilia sp. DWR3-1-1]|uniref:ribonuclease HI family protein n=1 Tax=Massilia sp. DWR3-1-1 TaxID=2804559 RepID=UPI003CF8D48F
MFPTPLAPDATDPATLALLSNRAERAASRRLAARGIGSDEALGLAMQAAAGGAARLPALLARRAAEQAAQAASAAAREQRRLALQEHRAALKLGVPTPWRGWFDGSAWPNPGRCGIGALLTGPAGEHHASARAAGYGNSSEAEYRALIALLEMALTNGAGPLTVYGDSKVVIDDVGATAARPAAALRPLREQAQALLARLPQTTLRWIPRHRNGAADALSQQGRAADDSDDANGRAAALAAPL